MRTLTLSLAAAATALALGGCGSEDPVTPSTDEDIPSIGGPSSSGTPTTSAGPTADAPQGDKAAVASTLKDVEAYAVQLEQVFFGSGYPEDLAGALKVADRLALELSPGNRIATYDFDAQALEFKLCVENASGAFAIYDTQPMSTLRSGATGGCP